MIIAAENMSEDEVFQLTKKLQQLFNKEDYDYKEIVISYYIPYEGDWIVRYMSQFTPKQDIRKKDIEVHNEFLFK